MHESIADDYVKALAERASHLPVGNPATEEVALGPIINEKQVQRVARIVDESVSQGANLVTGGTHEDLFFQPTVLGDVTSSMPAFTDEIFGPVAPVITFKDDAEAVELANATDYGLVAAVQSGSQRRAAAVGEQLHAGMVHMNDTTINEEPVGAVRRLRRVEQRRPLRRRREPRAVDRVAVADLARQGRAVPVLSPVRQAERDRRRPRARDRRAHARRGRARRPRPDAARAAAGGASATSAARSTGRRPTTWPPTTASARWRAWCSRSTTRPERPAAGVERGGGRGGRGQPRRDDPVRERRPGAAGRRRARASG